MPADVLNTLALRPSVRVALQKAKAELERIYGDRLVKMILFGSHVRGEEHPGSDVDVLVVLRGEVQVYEEIKRTSEVVSNILLHHHELLSLQPFSEEQFNNPWHPLARNVRSEGVAL